MFSGSSLPPAPRVLMWWRSPHSRQPQTAHCWKGRVLSLLSCAFALILVPLGANLVLITDRFPNTYRYLYVLCYDNYIIRHFRSTKHISRLSLTSEVYNFFIGFSHYCHLFCLLTLFPVLLLIPPLRCDGDLPPKAPQTLR